MDALGAMTENTKYADKSTDAVVEPEKIEHTFNKMGDFENEIRVTFPKKVNQLSKLRKTLKIHFLTLSNAIKDGELIAKSTKKNNKSARRVIDMRKRFKARNILNASREKKIWSMEIRKLRNNLEYSVK